ncbi:MAG: hypothetical protein WA988_14320, partial [Candidatus Nanopelagicales bacterium]
WIKRDASSSGFPAPAYGASSRSPLWRWADVAGWVEDGAPSDDRGRIIALINAVLLARRNLSNDAGSDRRAGAGAVAGWTLARDARDAGAGAQRIAE